MLKMNNVRSFAPIDEQLKSGPDTLCAAVSVRHRRHSPGHPDGRQGEVGHSYGILLLATDMQRDGRT